MSDEIPTLAEPTYKVRGCFSQSAALCSRGMGDNYVMRLLLTNDRSSARSRLALALVLAAALHMLLIANLNVSSQEPRQRLQALNLQLLAPRVDVPVPAA